MSARNLMLLAIASLARAAVLPREVSSSSTLPDYFQTTDVAFQGATATGQAPFLAQTNPVSFSPSQTYVPNEPLETSEPIVGNSTNQKSIFQLMGNLSPYFANNEGFGVDEYPLPNGAKIVQVQTASRHGSRYPTDGSSVATFGALFTDSRNFSFSGDLDFLNSWSYKLGYEILVARGRQELFDNGILHFYNYGQLYNTNSKIIARTTTENRMLVSAESFMAGFFGLGWANNATLELIIESDGYNNSLAGWTNCPMSDEEPSYGGYNASDYWAAIYLQDAVTRFNSMSNGFNWTISDVYDAQTLCPYETVAFGYSAFCDLFTYSEWEAFEYSLDLNFYGSSSFGCPTGRAMGIGYVQEVVARLQNHTLGYSGSNINTTLDNNTATFPLNQHLYLDFTHDSEIISILTAFGFTQFAPTLPEDHIPSERSFTLSQLTPFGARLDIEVIKTPQPLSATRQYTAGNETTYVHFLLNQRTIPLGLSFAACENRLDGWCELNTFLQLQSNATTESQFTYACFGDYGSEPWGSITNGAPL